MTGCFADLERALEGIECGRWTGRVAEQTGLLVESAGPAAGVGDICEIQARGGPVRAQVIGFRAGRSAMMPLEESAGLEAGDEVILRAHQSQAEASDALLGRILDGFGQPMDGKGPVSAGERYELYAAPPGPLEREPIREPLVTGIRAIDGLLTCGKGQRIGLFGGSGVGKSTLLGAMCRQNQADVSVVALIGERNREVREFIEHDLGAEGLARSVVVAATSDRPAPLRIRAAFLAAAIAEYFRDRGKNVLLVMDSVTRLAMAQREIGLAAGEPPSQKGYTPSVFALLPKLFERAGNFRRGSITGFFTVLVEGDDFNEPIADAVRAILDGHIVLSRALGAAGHYPAIDVLESVSRLASRVAPPEQQAAARELRAALAAYRQSEDLIQLGAYVAGSNPELDRAIALRSDVMAFLRQDADQNASFADTLSQLEMLASKARRDG